MHAADDEQASGKWLVPVALGDPDGVWEKLEVAAAGGILLAVKISSAHLDRILGHHLVCVYCETSDRGSVTDTLRQLRDIGVTGELNYKSDRATHQRREEYLWASADVEPCLGAVVGGEPKPSQV